MISLDKVVQFSRGDLHLRIRLSLPFKYKRASLFTVLGCGQVAGSAAVPRCVASGKTAP
jgi:hypothetical protein